ncbi:hypothetical protein SAMN03159496_02355 [Rhizobium sp. NFR07]|uniref:hypothetical protein n=1 Tax=Rhizobium sp. NFR07 TaxID=1566262 RepID=UPI0008DF20AB|nr:hypothetical protein [Rhizobium sp. NFR07]SFB20593.1 hypothetical protein SAMN03159496_02355 [Rhizobium sp. NFR07]
MTISDTADKQHHSFRWRLVTMLAVDLALTTAFVLGGRLAGHIPTDENLVAESGLGIFGLQAGGIFLWLGFQAVGQRLKLPKISLYRPWWRMRSRIRKRWIGERSKQDYRRAEAGAIVPVAIFVGIILLALMSLGSFIILLATAAVIVLIAVVAAQYRGAADRPIATMIGAAFFGFMLGYFIDFI